MCSGRMEGCVYVGGGGEGVVNCEFVSQMIMMRFVSVWIENEKVQILDNRNTYSKNIQKQNTSILNKIKLAGDVSAPY